jgi:hypothetical protein
MTINMDPLRSLAPLPEAAPSLLLTSAISKLRKKQTIPMSKAGNNVKIPGRE